MNGVGSHGEVCHTNILLFTGYVILFTEFLHFVYQISFCLLNLLIYVLDQIILFSGSHLIVHLIFSSYLPDPYLVYWILSSCLLDLVILFTGSGHLVY